MPRLPQVTGKDAIKAFQLAGFFVDRMTGSHSILKKTGHLYNISVPVHGNKPLKDGTLRSLIRDAGLNVEQFSALLEQI